MKGKLINPEIAILNISNHPELPDLGSYQAEVAIDSSIEITKDMIGKTFEFEIKVPCSQHCKRPVCSHIQKRVCEEATCFPVRVLDEIFIMIS